MHLQPRWAYSEVGRGTPQLGCGILTDTGLKSVGNVATGVVRGGVQATEQVVDGIKEGKPADQIASNVGQTAVKTGEETVNNTVQAAKGTVNTAVDVGKGVVKTGENVANGVKEGKSAGQIASGAAADDTLNVANDAVGGDLMKNGVDAVKGTVGDIAAGKSADEIGKNTLARGEKVAKSKSM